VITNVPGPRKPVYLAGTPIRAVLVWAPTLERELTALSRLGLKRRNTMR
jgi:hypothetical protein